MTSPGELAPGEVPDPPADDPLPATLRSSAAPEEGPPRDEEARPAAALAPPPRRLARAALVVPALGLAELGLHLHLARRAPDVEAWRAVAAEVAAQRQDGELVVVAPEWAQPLARHALGDAHMPLPDVARPDASRYRAAIELSLLGRRSPELDGWRERSTRSLGAFTLRALENPAPAKPTYVFTDRLDAEHAAVVATEPPGSCTFRRDARVVASGLHGHAAWPAERFDCPPGVYPVGVTVISDESFRPRRCIWVHPTPRGELVVRFREVPLSRSVRGHAGIDWLFAREGRSGPVTMRVSVGGETIGRHEQPDGAGWTRFEFDLGARAGTVADVEFAVSSPRNHERHFCFDADTR